MMKNINQQNEKFEVAHYLWNENNNQCQRCTEEDNTWGKYEWSRCVIAYQKTHGDSYNT